MDFVIQDYLLVVIIYNLYHARDSVLISVSGVCLINNRYR